MPHRPDSATRRDEAVAASIEILGTQGIRALTHGRVDERAGLPKGTTSNYFRTRAALFYGVVERMMTSELPAIDRAVIPHDVTALVDELVAMYEFFTGPNQTFTAARLALIVEAGHDPALREALARGRQTIEQRLLPTFAALRAPDPALAVQAVAVCFEGLFLHQLGQHASIDARRVIDLTVRAVMPSAE